MIRGTITRLRMRYYRRRLKATPTIRPVEPPPAEHTQRWCPEKAAAILVGPDGICPACWEIVVASSQPR